MAESKTKSKKAAAKPAQAAETETTTETEAETQQAAPQATAPEPQQIPRPAQPSLSHVLGEIAWLMSFSKAHQNFRLGDLQWFAVPPVKLQQYRMFLGDPDPAKSGTSAQGQGEVPMGVALWAMLSKEAERKFMAAVEDGTGPVTLKPADWNSGNRLWLIDLVAPFATPENKQVGFMMDDFIRNGPGRAYLRAKDHTLKFFQADKETGKRRVIEFTAQFKTADGKPIDPADLPKG